MCHIQVYKDFPVSLTQKQDHTAIQILKNLISISKKTSDEGIIERMCCIGQMFSCLSACFYLCLNYVLTVRFFLVGSKMFPLRWFQPVSPILHHLTYLQNAPYKKIWKSCFSQVILEFSSTIASGYLLCKYYLALIKAAKALK